ncbi:phosphoribosylglycinamide formyltransferase [Thiohalorhabdus methylotrophus]|uniref:Phosphoribosylglycinamide formyltransferase n=1 Tax=Thiohalorhabdus methylotrophus TaxID=3242694 RepID=A0ABV4TS84_9GAMM
MTEGCKCVVLVSGSGSNLQSLLDRYREGRLGAEVAAVVSNRPDAYALERAREAGVPARVVDHTGFPDRESFDIALREAVAEFRADVVVLAGFMRILTPEFLTPFSGRMINVHPSLLPAFRGLHTHRKALEAGCQVHGATVHLVTEDLDAGPIIAQGAVRIRGDDTPESLAQRVHTVEHRLLPQAVRWFAEGRLEVSGNRVQVRGHADTPGELLAPDVEPDPSL